MKSYMVWWNHQYLPAEQEALDLKLKDFLIPICKNNNTLLKTSIEFPTTLACAQKDGFTNIYWICSSVQEFYLLF